MWVTRGAWSLVTLVTWHVSHVSAGKFECPEPSGVFADPEQCDKYWVCLAGQLLINN